MTTEEFKDQIEALRRATSKACQSKEFAIKYLVDAGIETTPADDYDSDEFKAETYAMGKYNMYTRPDLFMMAFNERLSVLKERREPTTIN